MVKEARFQIEQPIGIGGSARVWRAYDTRLDRRVAIKRLLPHVAADPVAATRFEREARLAASLAHPGIVTVYDAGTDDEGPWIAMELVDGQSLAQRLGAGGALPVDEAVDLGIQLAGALEHAHQRGLVHRDVKPGNVMLRTDGRAQLVDFGISRAATDSSLTVTGSVVGTAAYLAPEVAAGANPTPAADIYGLGAVIYQALTGRTPFPATTLAEAVLAQQASPPPAPSALAPVPPAIDRVVLRCLARDPQARFGSAAEVATALAGASAGAATQALTAAAAAAPTEVYEAPAMNSKAAPTATATVPQVRAGAPRRRGRGVLVGVILTVLLLAAAIVMGNSLGLFSAQVPTTAPPPTPDTTLAAPVTTTATVTTVATTITVPATVAGLPENVATAWEEFSTLIAGLDRADLRPANSERILGSVEQALALWLDGDRAAAAEELDQALTEIERIRSDETRGRVFDSFVVLAETMGFQVQGDGGRGGNGDD